MKKQLSSIFLLLAPCLALMAMAFYLMRRAPAARTTGPFQIVIAGAEAQKIEAPDVFNGYDRRFQLVFEATGKRPKAWGTFDGSRSGTSNQTWKFWLERDGKRTAWTPGKTQVWTSGWDKDKKRYTNEFLIHSGPIFDDAALKMRGASQISFSGSTLAPFGPTIPFEVTLKKAGQKWRKPQVSTDPGMTIQKIEIQKPKKGRTVALVTLLLTANAEFSGSSLRNLNILNGDWSARKTFTNTRIGGTSNSRPEGSRRTELEISGARRTSEKPPNVI